MTNDTWGVIESTQKRDVRDSLTLAIVSMQNACIQMQKRTFWSILTSANEEEEEEEEEREERELENFNTQG